MRKNESISGVSVAIKNTLLTFQKVQPLIKPNDAKEFTIKIANTLLEREAVFQLGYQVYLEKGYIKENNNAWLVQNYDFNRDTTILIAQDKDKNIVGSVTLVFDGTSQLPAEKIYDEELRILRKKNEKIVEISRLIIDLQYRNSKEILVLLFNYLYIYSYFVKNYTCLAIEVNPRHTTYYQALLDFRKIGAEKPCPIVQSAPAILMYLPLKHAQDEVLSFSKNTESEKSSRSLYKYFIKPEQQNLVANYLEKQVRPMTAKEKIYFGFSESNNLMAVAI